jgi:hypothetical protein
MTKRTKAVTEVVTTLLEVGGVVAITWGVALMSIPAAWIVGGVAAIAVSYLVVRGIRR